jgi:hypothetical protein
MSAKISKVHSERKNREKLLLAITTVFFSIVLIGCASKREEEIPGANIVGIRASITKILLSPLAFDGAIVAVEGLARDVRKEGSNGQKAVTIFKLSDLQGNFINVSTSGTLEILENDYLVVGGIYRRSKNEIEAREIEKPQLEEKKKGK